MLNNKKRAIIDFVRANQPVDRSTIYNGVKVKMGDSTIRRFLLEMPPEFIKTNGNGKARTYSISDAYELLVPIEIEAYYNLLPEERNAKQSFNLDLIPKVLSIAELFTKEELEHLNQLHDKYIKNIAPLSNSQYRKELEILAIDLSWKSGEIEGNTYTLLEPDYLNPLTISRIENIHSILIKNLGVGGTEYKPLSLKQQISEVMQQMCDLVNATDNVFEKALLLLVLVSYIQPFNDGNKHTARIISNAILMENSYCPLSYRSVKASDYKKAMLLFYEQNNITEFKKTFMIQYEYAVNNYFNLDPEAAE